MVQFKQDLRSRTYSCYIEKSLKSLKMEGMLSFFGYSGIVDNSYHISPKVSSMIISCTVIFCTTKKEKLLPDQLKYNIDYKIYSNFGDIKRMKRNFISITFTYIVKLPMIHSI